MPVESFDLVPRGVVHNQIALFVGVRRDALGQVIQKTLKDFAVAVIEDQADTLAIVRADRAQHALAQVKALKGRFDAVGFVRPAAARSRIAFDSGFIGKPQFDLRIGRQGFEFLDKFLTQRFVLSFRPGPRHFEPKIMFVQITQECTVNSNPLGTVA